MKPFIEIIRPVNCAMASLGVFVGYVVSTGIIALPFQLLIALASAFAICGVGQAINDFFDAEIDRKIKPHRVIPRGELDTKTAFFYSFILFSVGVVLAYFITPVSFFIAATFAVLLSMYAAFIQQHKFIGNALVAAGTAITLIYGASISGNYSIVAIFAMSAFLTNMGREITKDIEDMEGDEGRKTTAPMLIGKEAASMLVLLFYTLGILIAAYAWFAGIAGSVFYIVLVAVSAAAFALAYSQLSRGNAAGSQRYSKGAMFIALLAFLASVM